MYLYQKLFVGIFWLLVAVFIFLWPWYFPDRPVFTIGHTGISMGWACVVLGLFNLVRWWLGRSAQARRRTQEESSARGVAGKSNSNSPSKQ